MDSLSALGVGANIAQIIGSGMKLVSRARELHKSTSDALIVNTELKLTTQDLVDVCLKLKEDTLTLEESLKDTQNTENEPIIR